MGVQQPEKVILEDGYVLIYKPDHPRSNRDGYISEHRMVMEEYLGGPIPNGHQVHHLDRRRTNNRIENLVLTPNKGLHITLHNMMKSPARQDLVRAMESWFKEITDACRNGYKQGAGAPVQLPAVAGREPRDNCDEPEESVEVEVDESQVAKVLLSVADRKVRARQFRELLAKYGEAELFDLLTRNHSLLMGCHVVRLIWSLGSLKVPGVGDWLLSLLDEWDTPGVHLAVYTQMFIRVYPGIDQEKLVGHVSRQAGGKPLAYGIKALGRQCSCENAVAALLKIGVRTDFGYDRERIHRAIAKAIRYINYRAKRR